MNPYDLVVCDLDGTLVDHDLQISTRVQAVIARLLRETQVRVVLATGRMFPSALPFAHKLGLSDPIITYQGAMVRQCRGQFGMLFHQPIAVEPAKAVLALCRELDLHLNVYINDRLYSENKPHYVALYEKTSNITPNVVPSMEHVLILPPTKLVIIEDDEAKLRKVRERLEAQFGADELFICVSRPNFLEITAAGVTKWKAVKELATVWSIPDERILCIGDQDNDVSMLQGAGMGVAMGNAPEAVKAVANRVALSLAEDGAAIILEELVLEPALEAKRLRALSFSSKSRLTYAGNKA
jgi:Cof subfamily protein (haloacid dehalogenase superfamily)